MRERRYKTILELIMRVAAILALSIPATGYTGNSIGSSSGYRGSHGISSGNRGLDRSHGRPSTHLQDNSHSSHRAAIKQQNRSGSASGDRGFRGISNGNRGPKESQGLQSLSRQKNFSRQRETDHRTRPRDISQSNRHATADQQKINGRNERFKTRRNPVIHKYQGPDTNFKSPANHTQPATIRRDRIKGQLVPAKPRKNLIRPMTIAQHRDNSDKIDAVFQTQHKQHISHTRHKHHGHHGHHIHHRHFHRFIFFPYVFFSYHSLYYPYSYYPGYYPYAYPVYRSSGYSPPAYSYEEPVYSTSKPYGIDSPGWTYLAQGDFQAAINVFAKDIQSFPDAGIPKVGFALASAAAGNLTGGVLAMREAYHVDPDSIHYLYFDKKVLAIIDDLIEKYAYELQQGNKRPDEAFMVSALHYLKHDYGSAHEAINRAITDGDKSPSLGNLHRLVDEQFSNEYAGEYN